MRDETAFGLEEELKLAAARGKRIEKTVKKLVGQTSESKNEAHAVLAAGKIWEIAQAFSAARRDYLKALEIDSELLEAKARLALVELKMGRREEGLEHAKGLTREHGAFGFDNISGNPISSMTVLGDALRINGDGDGAIQAYRAALEVSDKDGYSAMRLVELLVDGNLTREAAKVAEKYAELPELASLSATIRLLDNDPNRVPAIRGVVMFQARISNDMAA